MRFYDAETMRLLAAPRAGPRRRWSRRCAAALDLARSQAARPFELRIALDLHALLGEDARSLLEHATDAFDAGASTTELEEARARLTSPR